jgi:hypothetical protein
MGGDQIVKKKDATLNRISSIWETIRISKAVLGVLCGLA